jgi:CRP-like cAMP-binding protein
VAHNRLAYLNSNDWALLGAKVNRRVYKLGEEIIREGSFGDRICIIRAGEAAVELAGTGKQAVLAMLGPDDVCGDMAFLEKGRTTASVVAKDLEVEVDEILASDLRDLFEAFPRLAYRFYQSLAVVLTRRLRETSKALAREMFAAERRS